MFAELHGRELCLWGYENIEGDNVSARIGLTAAAILAMTSVVGCTTQATQASAPASAHASPASPSAARTSTKPTATGTTTPTASPTATQQAVSAKPVMARGSSGAQVRELQARLKQLGHFTLSPTGYYGTVTATAVRAFQAKHGLPASGTVTKTTWTTLRSLTREPTNAAMYPPTTRPVAKLDKRCLTGRVLCISKTSRTLSWVVDGKVLRSMDVRFGSQYTPTREGTFTVNSKSRHHVSTIYHTSMPYAMFFSGGQAVHYSADFAARGYAGASHGCVNVRSLSGISALFDQVRVGDKVVVYW
jgi:peptidoglycan hydrolase-like protein with peptidoglycan-binding domain